MRIVWVVLGMSWAVATAGPDVFAKRRGAIDRRFVREAGKLAREAKREGAERQSLLLYRSILTVHPEHLPSRRYLGYKKRDKVWTRDAESEASVRAIRDSDFIVARRIQRGRYRLLSKRVDALVDLCEELRDHEDARKTLLELLERSPRNAKVHIALGHERIGDSYVRPELVPIVRNKQMVLARWAAHRMRRPKVEVTGRQLVVPGHDAIPEISVGNRVILHDGVTLDSKRIAAGTVIADRFIGEAIGTLGTNWQPKFSVFVTEAGFERIIRKALATPREVKRALGYQSFDGGSFFLWNAPDVQMAVDGYAHRSALTTIGRIAAPKMPGQDPDVKKPKRDRRANAWLKEGFGNLVTLELYDTAISFFVSSQATESKRYTSEAPARRARTKAVVFRWVREHVGTNRHYPLRQLVGMSLNNLDDLGSLQAYTLVRFLFFVDFGGMPDFCAALADQTTGSPAERFDKALRRALGTNLVDVERLWRLFMLEVRQH